MFYQCLCNFSLLLSLNVCRLLIIAGDCDTICDVLLDVIPMLEEASAASTVFIHPVVTPDCCTVTISWLITTAKCFYSSFPRIPGCSDTRHSSCNKHDPNSTESLTYLVYDFKGIDVIAVPAQI